MTLHDRTKALARNRFQQLPQNRMLVAHAKLHSSSLDNRKVTATAWRCLACSRDQSTHSPDSPGSAWESLPWRACCSGSLSADGDRRFLADRGDAVCSFDTLMFRSHLIPCQTVGWPRLARGFPGPGEESPGSTEARCRVTPGGGDPRESATETHRQTRSAPGRRAAREKWCGKSAPRRLQ